MSEQKLDVYTYAAMKGAHFSVARTGTEWMSPCINPHCSSQHDAFSVQPEGKLTGRWASYGAWMCRKCWDPSEIIIVEYGPERGSRRKRGWGTIADLVMLCEQIKFREAERFILEYEGQTIPMTSRPRLQARKTDEVWFAESVDYLSKLQHVTQSERELVHTYLASRGLTVESAKRLGLGYSLDKVKLEDGTFREIPFLVIPWYKDRAANTLYRKIGRRNLHNPLPGDEPKYKTRWQSDNDMLYLGETLLTHKRPTFLVESELDAATVLQEAGDLVNVVATGSVIHGKGPVTESRLRRQPFVFVSFDADADGEKASDYWLGKLDSIKSVRYRPLMHDANQMLTSGLSVRKWVEAGLSLFAADFGNAEVKPPAASEPVRCSAEQVEPFDLGQANYEDERATWEHMREVRARASLPRWLIPGTDEWNKQVERNGRAEMEERRSKAIEQARKTFAAAS